MKTSTQNSFKCRVYGTQHPGEEKRRTIKRIGEESESHNFAENKNVWRHRIDQPVLLELVDEKSIKTSDDESQRLEVLWMKIDELLQKITHEYNKLGFTEYILSNDMITTPHTRQPQSL